MLSAIVLAALIPVAVYVLSPIFYNRTINEDVPLAKIGNAQNAENLPSIVLSGRFVGVDDGVHSTEGTAKILSFGSSNLLRLEDFRATNGPDLHVYLATDEKATEYVDLGSLKANVGNQNYPIPESTDLSKYDTALVWCKQFSVLFGHANLS